MVEKIGIHSVSCIMLMLCFFAVALFTINLSLLKKGIGIRS